MLETSGFFWIVIKKLDLEERICYSTCAVGRKQTYDVFQALTADLSQFT